MRFGYHVKVAGHPVSAIEHGAAYGCEAIQMFPGSPQQWGTKPVSDEEAGEFRAASEAAGIDPVVIHSIYLVNMAAPDDGIYKRSVGSLASSLVKADRLGAACVVTHIGNHRGEGEEYGLARIADAVNAALDRAGGEVMLLLETTAGAGTAIGNHFEQFGRVFELAGRPPRLGLCLDTCHVFAAGYDIRDDAGIEAVLAEVDTFIGLDKLQLLHLNDSQGALGSHKDRHADIGKGEIGLEAFRLLVNHPALRELAGIVELPHESPDSADSLGLLRSLVE